MKVRFKHRRLDADFDSVSGWHGREYRKRLVTLHNVAASSSHWAWLSQPQGSVHKDTVKDLRITLIQLGVIYCPCFFQACCGEVQFAPNPCVWVLLLLLLKSCLLLNKPSPWSQSLQSLGEGRQLKIIVNKIKILEKAELQWKKGEWGK